MKKFILPFIACILLFLIACIEKTAHSELPQESTPTPSIEAKPTIPQATPAFRPQLEHVEPAPTFEERHYIEMVYRDTDIPIDPFIHIPLSGEPVSYAKLEQLNDLIQQYGWVDIQQAFAGVGIDAKMPENYLSRLDPIYIQNSNWLGKCELTMIDEDYAALRLEGFLAHDYCYIHIIFITDGELYRPYYAILFSGTAVYSDEFLCTADSTWLILNRSESQGSGHIQMRSYWFNVEDKEIECYFFTNCILFPIQCKPHIVIYICTFIIIGSYRLRARLVYCLPTKQHILPIVHDCFNCIYMAGGIKLPF